MSALAVLLIYGSIAALIVVLGLVFYLRSVGSRKRYDCPQCGEQVSVELMRASHCSMCGAPLGATMAGDHQ